MPVTAANIITIKLTSDDVTIVRAMANMSAIGGRSNIRSDDRQAMLHEDQLVGHIGMIAASKLLFGSREPYLTARWYANQYRYQGDGGSDVPGANIDVKTSRMRGGNDPLGYRLAVTAQERKCGTIYVLALVDSLEDKSAHVRLLGWATSDMLPDMPDTEGMFAGAYVLRAHQLNPLMPINWWKQAA
jgi:hypothetical protein